MDRCSRTGALLSIVDPYRRSEPHVADSGLRYVGCRRKTSAD